MNHETGKSVKLDANDCKEMQTVLAENLGMERGTPKEDSGIEGLSAIEYKERKARENNQRLTAENAVLESRNGQLELQAMAAEKSIEELEQQRKEKKKALDGESGSALMSGVANLFGKGKYAEIEKENARLTAENNDMQLAVAKMEAQVAKIPMMVQRQVRQTIEEKTEEHLTEIRELNASHSRELSSFEVKLRQLSTRYRELESNNRHIIDNLKREKDTLLGEKLEKAVRALIQFARVLAYKTFTREHKEAIVAWLALDRDNPKSNAHFVKIFARPFLTDKEFDKGCKELDRLPHFFFPCCHGGS